MSRLARVVVPGLPHHATQRGNRRSVVFVDDADRFAYRQTVAHYFAQQQLQVWAYCLMTNHVHFVVVPSDEDALGRAFRDAHACYALAFNQRHRLNGHLWQGRFFPARSMATIFGPRCVTWNAIPCAQAWRCKRKATPGPVRRRIAGARQTGFCPETSRRRTRSRTGVNG